MMRRLLLIFCCGLLVAGTLRAQSLSGVRGLVTIPTAELPPDATLTMGFNALHKSSLRYHDGRYHARSPYLSLVYLPFLEIGLRLTRADSPIEEALGDRTVSLRALVFKEDGNRPAVLIGMHDVVGLKRHFQSTYLVASKTLRDVPAVDHVSVHLGYGARLIHAELYDFAGLFGGVAVAPWPTLRLLAEYNADDFNVGVDFSAFRRAHLVVGWTNFESLSAGAGLSVPLPH